MLSVKKHTFQEKRTFFGELIAYACSFNLYPYTELTSTNEITTYHIDQPALVNQIPEKSTSSVFFMVCYTAIFSVVTQRSSPQPRERNVVRFSAAVCGEEHCPTTLKWLSSRLYFLNGPNRRRKSSETSEEARIEDGVTAEFTGSSQAIYFPFLKKKPTVLLCKL